MPKSKSRSAALLAGCSIILWLFYPGASHAQIVQTVFANFSSGGSVDASNSDGVISDANGNILRDIGATITGTFGTASASAGAFGNLGISGEQYQPGEYITSVEIVSTLPQNPFGVPAHAVANFIIDGGSLQMLAGPESSVDFDLEIDADITTSGALISHDFHTRAVLSTPAGGPPDSIVPPVLVTSGANDIGITQDPSGLVTIPLSFQTLDLGIVDPGSTVHWKYTVMMTTKVPTALEVILFEFSDPLNIDGVGEAPTVTFTPAQSVAAPEPPTLVLFALGLAGFAFAARRRVSAPGH